MVAYLAFHSACENTRYEGMGMRTIAPRTVVEADGGVVCCRSVAIPVGEEY